MAYNKFMEIMPTPQPIIEESPTVRRVLAYIIAEAGKTEILVDFHGLKKMSRKQFLAHMVWDCITEGKLTFSDGTTVTIEEFRDWLDLVKFVSGHLDGPVPANASFQGINLVKIYAGFDPDKV